MYGEAASFIIKNKEWKFSNAILENLDLVSTYWLDTLSK